MSPVHPYQDDSRATLLVGSGNNRDTGAGLVLLRQRRPLHQGSGKLVSAVKEVLQKKMAFGARCHSVLVCDASSGMIRIRA